MDLHFNTESRFTKWIVGAGLLREPFVVIDVGVQGGENPRWHLLGDYLIVHGFDAIEEVVRSLQSQNCDNANRVYHWAAVGSVDEERTFYFNAADPCSSSFYAQGDDRFGLQANRIKQPRRVRVRRLDTLLAEDKIPKADFLKIDVEGFEKEVLLGASTLLNSVLGVETETNFNVSPTYRQSHFCEIHEVLLAAHLLVFDMNFNRVPRHSFQEALSRIGITLAADQDTIGRPATFNVLFCRDLIGETDHPENYTSRCEPVGIDQIIKTMIIYELYGLIDIALDTAVRFRDRLGARFDVEKAIALLADALCRFPGHGSDQPAQPKPGSQSELIHQLEELTIKLQGTQDRLRLLEGSISWQLMAPLRAVRRALVRS
jgi:FkbM family methyltransferase